MHNKPSLRPRLSRHDFQKLCAAGGITAAAAYLSYEYTPWLDYDQQADQAWRPAESSPARPALYNELVWYATLAANGHNTQPWKFAVQENQIEIHPDYSRRLPVVDPGDRELWISLGCALENLRSALLNQPVEAAELRPQLQGALGLGLHAPQLVVRFGSAGPAPRSLRRPLEQVLLPSPQQAG